MAKNGTQYLPSNLPVVAVNFSGDFPNDPARWSRRIPFPEKDVCGEKCFRENDMQYDVIHR